MNKLTHFDSSGQAHMVDVSDKASTHRVAIATGRIQMNPNTYELIESGGHKKGDVLGIARIADSISVSHKIARSAPIAKAVLNVS